MSTSRQPLTFQEQQELSLPALYLCRAAYNVGLQEDHGNFKHDAFKPEDGKIATIASNFGGGDVLVVKSYIPYRKTDAVMMRDDARKILWVAVRGTQEAHDFLCDAAFTLSNFRTAPFSHDAKVHYGFRQCFNKLNGEPGSPLTVLSDLKKEYEAFPGYTVVFVGHSLGGAVAQLLASGFFRDHGIYSTTVTFGSPRVGAHQQGGGQNFEAMLQMSTFHIRWFNDGDLISAIPGPSLLNIITNPHRTIGRILGIVKCKDQSCTNNCKTVDMPSLGFSAEYKHAAQVAFKFDWIGRPIPRVVRAGANEDGAQSVPDFIKNGWEHGLDPHYLDRYMDNFLKMVKNRVNPDAVFGTREHKRKA